MLGSWAYSLFLDVSADARRGQSKSGENVLSDSQSVPRVMNPRVRMGGAFKTLFELGRMGVCK